MQANELRMMAEDELRAKEQELRKTLFNLGIQKATGQLNNTSLLRKTRKDLARVLSVIREKNLKGKK
jgi:large subunit ribosomal protein L29